MSDIQWSIYVESVDGASKGTLTATSGAVASVTKWDLEARFNVAAAILTLEIENAVKFFPKYQQNNPFGMGAKGKIFFEGIQKFEGFIDEHIPEFSNNKKNLILKYKDKAGLLNHAALREENSTRVIRKRMQLAQKDSGSIIFFSPDFSGSATFPWGEEYLIPVFSGSSTDAPSERIPLSEYEILYDIGAIAWRNSTVRFLGDSSSGLPFNNVESWAHVAYYDFTDTTMRISEIVKRAFEYPQTSGGLGWTDGVDFEVEDTPGDVINRLKWITDENDGYLSDMLAWFYDNPAIGLAPSYQIHDYDGQGKVEAKLITQDSGQAKDVAFPVDAKFPSSIANIYSRIVTVNNTPTRRDISRDATLNFGSAITIPDVKLIGSSDLVRDYAVRTAFGVYKTDTFDLDENLPRDNDLVRYFFSEDKPVDTILLNATWIWTDEEGFSPTIDGVVNSIKLIHNNMLVTVEWTSNPAPTENDWFPIHPDLYLTEMDVLGGRDSWIIVEDIGLENVRGVRLMINEPLFAKVGESSPLPPDSSKADRMMAWFINEFRVMSKGKVLNPITEEVPEIKFVTDSGSSERFRPDLSDMIVNGGFSTASDWNSGTGWVIQDGKADKNAAGTGLMQQDVLIESGSTYILEYEISEISAGFLFSQVDGVLGPTRTANGRYYETLTALNNSGTVQFEPNSAARFKLDNVKLTKAIDMYRPKLTDKLSFMGIPWKTVILEVPDVYDFSGSGSVGNRIMTTQLDFYSKENNFEVEIITQPNIKLGDTVWHSRINSNFFTVKGFKIGYDGLTTAMFISLTDFETKIEGGA